MVSTNPRSTFPLAVTFLAVGLAAQSPGGPGLLGRVAPDLEVTHWTGLPKGEQAVEISDYRGKVIYLYFFQAWCPACSSHGFPLLKQMRKEYAKADDVVFLAVQTVFEGLKSNTRRRGDRLAQGKFGLKIPVGYDAAPREHTRTRVMDLYRTGGTPWTVLIDKRGIVRFNGFGMKLTKASTKRRIEAMRMVGNPMGSLESLEFMGKRLDLAQSDYTLLRWFRQTDESKRSLQALEMLRARHERLTVLALWPDTKAGSSIGSDAAWAAARRMKFGGRVAVDRKGVVLAKLRKAGLADATDESSVLVDKKGRIVWVDAGRRLHPAQKLRPRQKNPHAAAARSFADLEGVLSSRPAKSTAGPKPTSRRSK